MFFLLEAHVRYAFGEVHPRAVRDAICQPVAGLFIEVQEVPPPGDSVVACEPQCFRICFRSPVLKSIT